VDLVLERGESLALIGANGAGKSTLLRLVAGLSGPSFGDLDVSGTVRSLLDLGAGFIEELTGRENAFSLLAIDGVERERRAELVERALGFASLGAFADQPVRTYSAGMRLRLAYALAVALPADLLVADEVLAVGDEEFQRRCATELRRFLEAGGSLLLASHNLYHVEKLCGRAIWLEAGRIRAAGPARHVTASYRDSAEEAAAIAAAGAGEGASSTQGAVSSGPRDGGSPREAAISLRTAGSRAGARRVLEGERIEIAIRRPASSTAPLRLEILRAGVQISSTPVEGERATIERWPLLPGRYRLRLVEGSARVAREIAGIDVETLGTSRETGTCRLSHAWS
jgi:homopolymeric O-antigen transport system ATP-binding protein